MDALLKEANRAFLNRHYHTARKIYKKAANRYGESLVSLNLRLCDQREISRFQVRHSTLVDKLSDEPLITYCVPCFDRLADLKSTLGRNLRILERFNKVRLILNLFDRGSDSYQWVTQTFQSHLESGLLQVNREAPLEYWHAPTAKNSFRERIGGGYYAALDCDNYLSEQNVARTKQVVAEYGPCIIHQFAGNWGDGTCGGVVLPADIYRQQGYTESLLPRQFEELSLLANAMKADPTMPLVTRNGVNILEKSACLKELAELNGWSIKHIECDLGAVSPPEGKKRESYAAEDPLLWAYGRLNSAYSALKASVTERARLEFSKKLSVAQKEVMASETFPLVAERVLEPQYPCFELSTDRRQPQIAVIRSCDQQLLNWVWRQRQKGYRRFLLVNASGDNTFNRELRQEGATLFTPRLGDVDTFKDFWLACLSCLYKEEGRVNREPVSLAAG